MRALRPDAPSPLYQQIKEQIHQRIDSGAWPPGRRIPSESQLVGDLGVSRMTVHRALRELAQEGRLQRVAGVGTFVAEPPRHLSLIELRNVADEIRAEGGEHSARLVLRESVPADEELAVRMELAAGSRVFHVVLVHRRDGLPIQLEERWVNPELVPGFLGVDFAATTPSEVLLRTIRPQEMEHVVQAVMPEPATRELLAVPAAEPCLRLLRRTWNGGRVVTAAVLTYPSSRYDLGARYTLGDGAAPIPMNPPARRR